MQSAAQSTQTTTTDRQGLRSVPEVAAYLALSRSKVYQLMESGGLPYVKLGKSRRVRWTDVLKLVDDNTVARAVN